MGFRLRPQPPSEHGDNSKTYFNANAHSAADVPDGRSELLCPCGNAIPPEKWARLDKGKRTGKLWIATDFATRGTAAGLAAAAD